MMLSRTSTANNANSFSLTLFGRGIFHELAKDAALGCKNIRQPRGKLVKVDRRRNQRIERRVGEEIERGGEPARMRPAGAVRRRDPADLARYQPEAAAVKGAAQRHADLVRPVPVQFQDARLF